MTTITVNVQKTDQKPKEFLPRLPLTKRWFSNMVANWSRALFLPGNALPVFMPVRQESPQILTSHWGMSFGLAINNEDADPVFSKDDCESRTLSRMWRGRRGKRGGVQEVLRLWV